MMFKMSYSLLFVLSTISIVHICAAFRFDIPNSLYPGPVSIEYTAGSNIDDGPKVLPRPNTTSFEM